VLGVLLVFDVTEEATFNSIEERWMTSIREHNLQKDAKLMLIGNKIDLEDERVVTKD
jgi:GTPase SAR1 family protein